MHLNAPIVGMAADRKTGGYWLVASDGGIFTFGAPFLGSAGARRLHAPIVGMAANPSGRGYRLAGADGAVVRIRTRAVVRIAGRSPGSRAHRRDRGDRRRTRLLGGAANGAVYTFGNAGFFGAASGRRLNAPIVGIGGVTDAGICSEFAGLSRGDFDLGPGSALMGAVSDEPPQYLPSDPEPIELEPIDLAAETTRPDAAVSIQRATRPGRNGPGRPVGTPIRGSPASTGCGTARPGRVRPDGPATAGDSAWPPVRAGIGARDVRHAPFRPPTPWPRPCVPPVAAAPRRSWRSVLVLSCSSPARSDTRSNRAPSRTPLVDREHATAAATTPGSVGPAPSTADRLALSSLVVRQADVGPTRVVVLIPNGNRTTEPTLDLCNGTFPSEKQRVARLQVADVEPERERSAAQHRSGDVQASHGRHAGVRGAAQGARPRARTAGRESGRRADRRDGVQGPRPTAPGRTRSRSSGWPTASRRPRPDRPARRSRCTCAAVACSWACTSRSRMARSRRSAGKTSIEGIVGVFEARMARLPANVVNG